MSDKFKCEIYQNINDATLRSRCWVFTKVSPERIDSSLDSGPLVAASPWSKLSLGSLPLKESNTSSGNTGGTATQYNSMHVRLVYLVVVQDILDRLKGATEEVLAKSFEPSMG